MELKKCYICERDTDNWIEAHEIEFENEELEEEIVEHYFVHCVGSKDMFTEEGGVVVCRDCSEILSKGMKVHICYNCKKPTMDYVAVDIPFSVSAFSVPGKYVTNEYKLVVCNQCVKIAKGLLGIKRR